MIRCYCHIIVQIQTFLSRDRICIVHVSRRISCAQCSCRNVRSCDTGVSAHYLSQKSLSFSYLHSASFVFRTLDTKIVIQLLSKGSHACCTMGLDWIHHDRKSNIQVVLYLCSIDGNGSGLTYHRSTDDVVRSLNKIEGSKYFTQRSVQLPLTHAI